jgi:membrane protein implicated in regulation of membrane protease activity
MLKWLVTLIAALLILGLFTPWLNRLGLGRLPGDLRIKRARGTFYFPFTSVILMSLLLSLLAYLLGRSIKHLLRKPTRRTPTRTTSPRRRCPSGRRIT